MGFCHNFKINQQPTKTTIKSFYTFEITKPLTKFWRYLLGFDFFQKKIWKNEALVAGMCATGGAPKSQSRVDRQYDLCWWWMCQWCAGDVPESGSVSRLVGVEGDGVGGDGFEG